MSTPVPSTQPVVPPYLTISRLDKVFSILSAKSPVVIKPELFMMNGFSKHDASLALRLLQFLRLTDTDNNALPAMGSLRTKGDDRKQQLRPLIQEAYKPLFENIDAPYDLPKQDLLNSFNTAYPKVSDRVFVSAIPLFLKLCEYAGLKEEGAVRGGWTNKGSGRVAPRTAQYPAPLSTDTTDGAIPAGASSASYRQLAYRTLTEQPSLAQVSGMHTHQVLKGKVNVSIPEEWNTATILDDSLNDSWRTAIKALHAYVDRYQALHPEPAATPSELEAE